MGLTNELKKQALALSQKAMEKLFADEQRAQKIASAIGSVQRGKQALDRGQDQLMHAFSFATRSDYKAVGKQLSSLKRRVRELDEKLDALLR
ncbi:MAG TPA: hypothetical protein VFA20_21990 [Myxococcaceae bacterium]|nr:hypothetical protein [Myxococcaceae bacterium]